MIKKFFVLGERCSGTNYLHQLILKNFVLDEWECGHKHFFLTTDFRDSRDVLILAIIRHPVEWLASLRHNPHHLEYNGRLLSHGDPLSWPDFLNMQVKSVHCYPADDVRFHNYQRGSEIVEDRNPETGQQFHNLFELRRTKNQFLDQKMKHLVPNYSLVVYDQLVRDAVSVLGALERQFGLTRRQAKYCNYDLYKSSRIPYVAHTYSYEIPVNIIDSIVSRLDSATEQKLGFRLSLKTALVYEPNQCHTELFPFWVETLLNAGFRVDLAFNNATEIGEFIKDRFATDMPFIQFVDRKKSRQHHYDMLVLNSFYAFGRDIVDYMKFNADIRLIVYHNTAFLPSTTQRERLWNQENIIFVNLHLKPLASTCSLLPLFQYRTSRPRLSKTLKLFTIINNRSDLDLFRRTVSRLSGFEWIIINNLSDNDIYQYRLAGILKNPRLRVFYKISESKKFRLVEASHFVICFQNNREYQTFRLSGLIPLALSVRRPLILERSLANSFQLTEYYDINTFKWPVDIEQYRRQLDYLKSLRSQTGKRNAQILSTTLTKCNNDCLLTITTSPDKRAVAQHRDEMRRSTPVISRQQYQGKITVSNRIFKQK